MKTLPASCLPLILGVIVLGIPACSKKAVRSGGDTQALQEEMARGELAKGGAAKEGTSSSFPDTSFSGRDDSSGLRGLDRNPSEERLGGNGSSAGSQGGTGHSNAVIVVRMNGRAFQSITTFDQHQVVL